MQCKHIDFVLCDRKYSEPLLAIELDDSSHKLYDHQESDEVKDHVCAEAGLPLLRVKVQQADPIAQIQAAIRAKIDEAKRDETLDE